MHGRSHRPLLELMMVICVCMSAICPGLHAQAAGTDEEAAREGLIDAYRKGEKSLNVAEYDIGGEQWMQIFEDIMQSGEIPWYCSYPRNIINTPSGKAREIVLSYLEPGEYDYDQYEKNAQRILDEALYPGMNDWQKALAIHDRLVEWGQYDRSLTYHMGYDYLVRGTAVCEGYSEAYMDLMNRAGVRCIRTTSLEMNHTWNMVEIDGCWYHVDVTWDDPIPDERGRVYHTYFLKTDEEVLNGENPHYHWDKDLKCDSARFSEAYWNSVGSGIIYLSSDDSVFCVKDALLGVTDIYAHRDSTGEQTLLCKLPEEGPQKGMRLGGRMWGLSMWNDMLYTGYGNTVYALQQDGSDPREIYRLDDGETQIRGISVRDNQIFMTVSEFGGTDLSEKREPLPQEYTGLYMKHEQGCQQEPSDEQGFIEDADKNSEPGRQRGKLVKRLTLGSLALVLAAGGTWLLLKICRRPVRVKRKVPERMEFRPGSPSEYQNTAQMKQRIEWKKNPSQQKPGTNPFRPGGGYSGKGKK